MELPTSECKLVQIASWAELNRFLDEFAQKTHGPIARCLLARLITQSSSPGQPQPWQPCVAMMQNALGIPPLASLSSPLGIPAVFSQYTLLVRHKSQPVTTTGLCLGGLERLYACCVQKHQPRCIGWMCIVHVWSASYCLRKHCQKLMSLHVQDLIAGRLS